MNRVLMAFEDRIQMELVRVRWEEIKKLQVQPALAGVSLEDEFGE